MIRREQTQVIQVTASARSGSKSTKIVLGVEPENITSYRPVYSLQSVDVAQKGLFNNPLPSSRAQRSTVEHWRYCMTHSLFHALTRSPGNLRYWSAY